MKREVIKSAKTLEEAIKQACLELGEDRDDVSVEVLAIPKRGFFRLGKVEAKVKVTSNKEDVNKLEVAKNYLHELLSNIGLENFDIDINEKSERKVVFTLRGDNLGLVIGKRGETLNALQQLCSVAANMSGGEYYTVIIDVGDYRRSREQALRELAVKISKSAIRSGRRITLEPMNAYERRIIHATIQNISGVDSKSRGEDPHRYIVVFPINNNFKRENRMNLNNNFRYNNIK